MQKTIFAGIVASLLCMAQAIAAPLEKLTVILDWFPNPDHAPLIVAKQQGFFAAQGLDVELIGPADPSDPPKMVAAKKADIGITYEPQYMQQVDQGLPIIAFGTLIDKPLDCLVTLKDSGIRHIDELKGKRIGSALANSMSGLVLKTMLTRHGLNLHDVQLVNVRYNLIQSLLSKKIDAVTGLNRNIEVPQIDVMGHKVNVFMPEENGVPTYDELIFITHIDQKKDPRLQRFLLAIKKAIYFLDKNKESTWQAFAKTYPEANNKVNQEAWNATLPYFTEEPGNIDDEEWHNFAEFLHKNKLIKKVASNERYFYDMQMVHR